MSDAQQSKDSGNIVWQNYRSQTCIVITMMMIIVIATVATSSNHSLIAAAATSGSSWSVVNELKLSSIVRKRV